MRDIDGVPGYIPNMKYWVQLVTPLVYDDSISLYEAMRKVVYKLNQVIDIVNPLGAGIEGTIEKYLEKYKAQWEQELQEYQTEVLQTIAQNNAAVNLRIDGLFSQQAQYEQNMTQKFNDLNAEIMLKVATISATIASTDEANRTWTLTQIQRLKEDWTVNFPPVIDPTDGQLETVQTALNHIWDAWRDNALTADEYDNLQLTGNDYDSKELTASSYDKFGRLLLAPNATFAMVSGVPINKSIIDMEGIKNGRY